MKQSKHIGWIDDIWLKKEIYKCNALGIPMFSPRKRVYQDELDYINKINTQEDKLYRGLMAMEPDWQEEKPLYTEGTLVNAVIVTTCIICAIVLIFVSFLNI